MLRWVYGRLLSPTMMLVVLAGALQVNAEGATPAFFTSLKVMPISAVLLRVHYWFWITILPGERGTILEISAWSSPPYGFYSTWQGTNVKLLRKFQGPIWLLQGPIWINWNYCKMDWSQDFIYYPHPKRGTWHFRSLGIKSIQPSYPTTFERIAL